MQNTTTPILENVCANCVAVTNGEETYLFSYESPILKIKNDEIIDVYPNYDYSITTTKHINKFIDQYGYLNILGKNIFTMENPKRKKLIKEFYEKTAK
jgi:hypothetical protein